MVMLSKSYYTVFFYYLFCALWDRKEGEERKEQPTVTARMFTSFPVR